MNLATAINIMEAVAVNDGEIGFDSEDPTSRWFDAWWYFKRRPRLRLAYEGRWLSTMPLQTPSPGLVVRLDDVKEYLSELVEVFKLLKAWDDEVAR